MVNHQRQQNMNEFNPSGVVLSIDKVELGGSIFFAFLYVSDHLEAKIKKKT